MKFGIYLSPWDRNHPAYGQGDSYNDVYCAQLTELLTGYGEIFCVWLDGACGSYMDGKPKQIYDWDRYFSLIRKLAPKACISNCGPDIRWVGNEGGFARESECRNSLAIFKLSNLIHSRLTTRVSQRKGRI